MSKEYSPAVQKLFLEIMLTDAQSFVRVQSIYNPDNFDRSLRSAAVFLRDHADKYKTLPTPEQIEAVTETKLTPIPDISDSHLEWFLEEFESFNKRAELNRAILKAADMIEKGDYDPVEKIIKDAVQISLTRDLGLDYFADPKSRLMKIKDNNGQMSTGWPTLDSRLYGGFNRGELNIFCGGSGSGKSLFLQNLSINFVEQGLHGAYITLELSEELCAMRVDSMLTSTSAKNIFKEIDDVTMKVVMKGKKSGMLRIKYMPAQSNINQLRSYLKELMIQTGRKLDFIAVDYLDLLMPVSAKVSPSDLFVKDKYVSEELRNLGKEFEVCVLSASQLNRSATEEVEFNHSHISGGISKINTADNVFGIFTSRAIRERGQYQLQLMKTRNSSGVGQKIELEFNIESLRITDPGEAAQTAHGTVHNISEGILSKIKSGNSDTASTRVPPAQIQGSKLKSMLASIKSSSDI